MSKFLIQVNAAPYGNSSSYNAYQFVKALTLTEHEIIKVFFYQDGVQTGNTLLSPASDEFDLLTAWRELSQRHNISLINCVSASLRRGVLSKVEAKEEQYSHWNMDSVFTMGGLGELISGIEQADRTITF